MPNLGRLSHVAFNIPSEIFDKEVDFWENVVGLRRVHGTPGRNVFFTSDPFRDHEFILFRVEGPIAGYDSPGCMVNHVAFDVATDAEVDAFTERLRAHGYEVEEPPRERRQNKVTSPAGIHFEVNTPPYMNPSGRADA